MLPDSTGALGNWVGFAEIAMLTHHYKEAIHAYEQALKLPPYMPGCGACSASFITRSIT